MNVIKFRPLRRDKKTGKVMVASYLSWHKLTTANYQPYRLVIDTSYRDFKKDELVYNHKGKNLFFYNYMPSDIPVYNYVGVDIDDILDNIEVIHRENIAHAMEHESGNTTFSGKGIDCNGTPTFSHFDADYLADFRYNIDEFIPLTVKMVIEWYGWFLLRLENAKIEIK